MAAGSPVFNHPADGEGQVEPAPCSASNLAWWLPPARRPHA